MAQEMDHLHSKFSKENIHHHQQLKESMRHNYNNHLLSFKMQPPTEVTKLSLLSPPFHIDGNNEDVCNDFKIQDHLSSHSEKQSQEDHLKGNASERMPPKSMLSPTTTRDIYENRLKPASSMNYQQSMPSPKLTSLLQPTTVTAQRHHDLKLRAEQQNHDQIELKKASLRQGDELAL